MSTFEARVYKLEILPHPNADVIELARVGDYVSIVKKGDFKTGDLGVYIPEAALVPSWMLVEIGLEGKLSGSEKNRVKAIKLRKVLSQGLIYPVKPGPDGAPSVAQPPNNLTRMYMRVQEGDDVAAFLGIKKWEPVIPQHMRGRAVGVAQHLTINYDIENIKKYNRLFSDGEQVAITEKIHGTFSQFGYIPQRLFETYLHLGCYTVTSKGLGGRGILLDFEDRSNVYAKIAQDSRYGIGIKLPVIKAEYRDLIGDNPIYICGEIFGPGVQKGFGYGVGGGDVEFRMFDVAYGERSNLRYLDFELLEKISKDYELLMVPLLYKGPFSKEILAATTNGKETVSGKALHIREGGVTKPLKERHDDETGRVILKSVSEAYLLGDNTEYQ